MCKFHINPGFVTRSKELSSAWHDEVAAGFGRELSMLMYLDNDVTPDMPLGRLLQQLHTRSSGELNARHAMAYCLYAFGRSAIGKLEFPMDKRPYMAILASILERCVFKRVYWTCPFSPVFHYIEYGEEDLPLWKAFQSYGDRATRIVYLPNDLYDLLLLGDQLRLASRPLASKAEDTAGEILTRRNDTICIIDVRKALWKFIEQSWGTKTYFSCPRMFEVSSHSADTQTKLGLYASRVNMAKPLRDDYGLYEVSSTRLGISWDPQKRRAGLLLDIRDGDEKWTPFEYFRQASSITFDSPLFIDLEALVNEIGSQNGGRKFTRVGDRWELSGQGRLIDVPNDKVEVVVNHLLFGV